MTYTANDLKNVRAAIADAVTAVDECTANHSTIVAEVRAAGGDKAIFAAEHADRITNAITERAKAAEELARLRSQEATIVGFLGGAAGSVSTPAKGEDGPTGDWAARAASGELFKAYRESGLHAVRDLSESLFTREELQAIFQPRAFDASAGAGLRTPEYKPILLEVFNRRPRLLDFITVGSTNTDLIDWVVEGSQTNNVGYAEYGSTVSESAYSFSHVDTTVSRITAWISATDGQLADAGQSETLLRQRLVKAVNRFVESEVFAGDGSGSGSAKHLTGFTVAAAANTTSVTGLTPFDAVMEGIVKIQTDSYMELDPRVLIIHPTDYKKLVLEKDESGQYQVANPTSQNIVPIWGLTPVITPLATAGAPWVADAEQYNLWVRSGLELSISDNVASNFLNGIKVIKGEMRLGGATLRTGAFRQLTSFGA